MIKKKIFFFRKMFIVTEYAALREYSLQSFDEYLKKLERNHTGKCIRRFGGIYAYCRYFIDRK